MKNFLLKTTLLVLCMATMVLALSSCSILPLGMISEDNRGAEFMTRVEKKGNKMVSYTQNTDVDLSVSYSGSKMNIKSTGSQYFVTDKSEFKHLVTDKTTVSTNGTTTEIVTVTEGYQNGYLFSSYKESDGGAQKVKSKMSAEEYIDYFTHKEGSLNIDYIKLAEGAATQSVEKNDDGEWVANFSNLSEESLKAFDEYLADITESIENCPDLKDVEITVTADKNFFPKSYLYKIVFENDEDSSSEESTPIATNSTPKIKFTITSTVVDINETKLKDTDINSYEEFEDLREFDTLEKALDDKKTGSGRFELNLRSLTTVNGETVASTDETDQVTYSLEDGEVNYEILARLEDYTVKINYESGIRKTVVSQSGKTVSSSSDFSTDYEGKQQIFSLMDAGSFRKIKIESMEIKVSEDNVTTYEIELIDDFDETITTLVNTYNAYNMEPTISDAKLVMKLNENNELIYYKYEARVKLEGAGAALYQKIVATCTFK